MGWGAVIGLGCGNWVGLCGAVIGLCWVGLGWMGCDGSGWVGLGWVGLGWDGAPANRWPPCRRYLAGKKK